MVEIIYNFLYQCFVNDNSLSVPIDGELELVGINNNNTYYLKRKNDNSLELVDYSHTYTLDTIENIDNGFSIKGYIHYEYEVYLKFYYDNTITYENKTNNNEKSINVKFNNFTYKSNQNIKDCIYIDDSYKLFIDKENSEFIIHGLYYNTFISEMKDPDDGIFFYRSHLVENFNNLDVVNKTLLSKNSSNNLKLLYFINSSSLINCLNTGNNIRYGTLCSLNTLNILNDRKISINADFEYNRNLFNFRLLNNDYNVDINDLNYSFSYDIEGYYSECGDNYDFPSLQYKNFYRPPIVEDMMSECNNEFGTNYNIDEFIEMIKMNLPSIKTENGETLQQKPFENNMFDKIKENTILVGVINTKSTNSIIFGIIMIFFKDNNKCDVISYYNREDSIYIEKIPKYSSNDVSYSVKSVICDDIQTHVISFDQDNSFLINYENVETMESLHFAYKYYKGMNRIIPPQVTFYNTINEESDYMINLDDKKLEGYSDFYLCAFIDMNKEIKTNSFVSFYSNYQVDYNTEMIKPLGQDYYTIDFLNGNTDEINQNIAELERYLTCIKEVYIVYSLGEKMYRDYYILSTFHENNYGYYDYEIESFEINYGSELSRVIKTNSYFSIGKDSDEIVFFTINGFTFLITTNKIHYENMTYNKYDNNSSQEFINNKIKMICFKTI